MVPRINSLADHEMALARAVPQAMPGWDTCRRMLSSCII